MLVVHFPTKGILQDAIQGNLGRLKDSDGKPPGLIGILPQNAVTFIDNHDNGSTQHMLPFPSDKVIQGYAYILTHPGVPSVSKYTRGVLQRANMEGEKPIWTPMVGGLQFFKTGSESFNDPALYRSLAGLEACIFQALKGTMTSGLHRQHSC
ncbi:Alpha-amylase [Capsicum chinense]|nr:Alpha-amylase [Capsicum chinense]